MLSLRSSLLALAVAAFAVASTHASVGAPASNLRGLRSEPMDHSDSSSADDNLSADHGDGYPTAPPQPAIDAWNAAHHGGHVPANNVDFYNDIIHGFRNGNTNNLQNSYSSIFNNILGHLPADVRGQLLNNLGNMVNVDNNIHDGNYDGAENGNVDDIQDGVHGDDSDSIDGDLYDGMYGDDSDDIYGHLYDGIDGADSDGEPLAQYEDSLDEDAHEAK